MLQQQAPQISTVAKTLEAPPVPFIGRTVDVPVMLQRQVHRTQTVAKTVEVSPVPFVNRVVKAPVIMQIKKRQCPSINQVTEHVVTPPPVEMSRQGTQVQTLAQMAVVPVNSLRRPNMQPCVRLKPCSGCRC